MAQKPRVQEVENRKDKKGSWSVTLRRRKPCVCVWESCPREHLPRASDFQSAEGHWTTRTNVPNTGQSSRDSSGLIAHDEKLPTCSLGALSSLVSIREAFEASLQSSPSSAESSFRTPSSNFANPCFRLGPKLTNPPFLVAYALAGVWLLRCSKLTFCSLLCHWCRWLG